MDNSVLHNIYDVINKNDLESKFIEIIPKKMLKLDMIHHLINFIKNIIRNVIG